MRARWIVITAIVLVSALAVASPLTKLIPLWRAAHRPTTHFIALDAHVAYEPGAEHAARIIADAFPTAIATVQRALPGPFTIEPRSYACASIASFVDYGASPRAGGLTINHRIFVSPKPENTDERLPRIVTHELTHLYLHQHLGLLDSVPVWLDEGLAVEVSRGGGAENVSEAEAQRALDEGQSFTPDTGSLLHRRGAAAFHLPEHLFYRQAGMFVAYLRALDDARFRAFLDEVAHGADTGDAFSHAFGFSLTDAWRRFLAHG